MVHPTFFLFSHFWCKSEHLDAVCFPSCSGGAKGEEEGWFMKREGQRAEEREVNVVVITHMEFNQSV